MHDKNRIKKAKHLNDGKSKENNIRFEKKNKRIIFTLTKHNKTKI